MIAEALIRNVWSYAVLSAHGLETQEGVIARPDLDTVACVNPEYQLFRRPETSHFVIRQSY